MEIALLALVLVLQVVILALTVSARKPREDGGESETRLLEFATTAAERTETALEALREEVSSVAGSLRASIGELASEVRTPRQPSEPGGSSVNVTDEIRPLLREAVESLDARLRELTELVARGGGADDEEIVTRALESGGYDKVSLVDRPERQGSRLVAVVEARRAGMTYKGRVTLEGAELVEQDLAPMHRMFP